MPPAPLRVLAVASECYPLVKTGGLADVVGALPAALAAEAVAVTTLLPGYPKVMEAVGGAAPVRSLPDLFGGPARVLAARAEGLELRVLDAPHLYARPGNPYLAPDGSEWGDNALRFAGLGAAAALLARAEGFAAVHAHDWQAGLAGAYLRYGPAPRVPSVFTIHNLAFQGQFPATFFPRLGLPPAAFAMAGLEHYGSVGFLKSGLWFADRITTVSPTYAAEIRTPEGGMGLDGLLRGRSDSLHGILNGLDPEEWNPATDARLPARFSAADPAPRAANKAALQRRLGLAADPDAPLFAFVGRLAWQKGMDLVLEALPALLGNGAQLAILGTGDAALEARCLGATAANPGRIGTMIAFDEALARFCYGGADLVLVPSRFEPCGLAQLCALRYGAPPLVARVGGLADTVIDANEMALAAGAGTGLQFAPVTAEMLGATIQRGIGLWRDRAAWRRIQANALATDVSWRRSARRYAALFQELAATDA
ncbi:glycogen synthase 2 [Siccirubricoccus deserti]|uniref:Glycogen synthase n=1 Tax=Siccirubricoccus deserti TaxID=2013562 RepID=A0A9X0QVG6_9PROT|nr:glycogen synthase GlgA [Siccirubricoccus deserti]MBC4014701.1 glycogen synthase GlgA [Siccirubricoccus deserti]GGC34323.1 glycogen synthase 2 [Siccirubricoccus deserti]